MLPLLFCRLISIYIFYKTTISFLACVNFCCWQTRSICGNVATEIIKVAADVIKCLNVYTHTHTHVCYFPFSCLYEVLQKDFRKVWFHRVKWRKYHIPVTFTVRRSRSSWLEKTAAAGFVTVVKFWWVGRRKHMNHWALCAVRVWNWSLFRVYPTCLSRSESQSRKQF